MTDVPAISEEDIEHLVGRRGLQRGWDYFRSAALVDACRQGNCLRASCLGSGRRPYRISIEFDETGIRSARCTCPVGEHGHCKHVAAVLVCWREAPQQFTAFEAWEESLARCSREQLLDIVKRLLEHRPDLRRMIESLIPPEETLAVQPPPDDPSATVRQSLRLLQDNPEQLVSAVTQFKEHADDLIAQRDLLEAASLYQALLQGLLDLPGVLVGQRSELSELVQESAEALINQLPSMSRQAKQRQTALRTLLDLYCRDVCQGTPCLEIDLLRLLLPRIARRERQMLADWIRSLLAATECRAARRQLGGLILELEGQWLDDQGFVELCRQTDRVFDLVRHLIQRGQLQQALEEAGRSGEEDLLRIADTFVQLRQEQAALQLIHQRLQNAPAPHLQQWLEGQQRRQQQQQGLLEAYEKVFRLQPTLGGYRQVRRLARQLRQWDALRERLLELLRDPKYLPLLVRIYLEENDLGRALAEVGREPILAQESGLALRVAKAAERSRPLDAIPLYREAIERAISRRSRDQYALACRHLRKLRRLSKRSGDLRGWKAYLHDLQRRHQRLLPFLEELDNAGLLKKKERE